MEKEKLTPINTINGIEINEELMQKVISVPKRDEIINAVINSYLISQLGINENQVSE
ncbi:MAG: hypothetical protein V8R00_02035 [Coprococcus catus]